MSIIVAVIVVAGVGAGGLTPALAGELEGGRRDARELAWAAARAKARAGQMSWARDRAQDTQARAWDNYMSDYGSAAARVHWEQSQANTQGSKRAAWDAAQAATEAETKAKEAQKRVSLKSIMIEAIQDLKG